MMGITGSSSVFKHLSSKFYIYTRVRDKIVSDGAADVLRERFNIRTLESSPEVGRLCASRRASIFTCLLHTQSLQCELSMYSPKTCVEHDPRASCVVFRGEEAIFSERHIANERQDQHGDAQNHQTEGLGDADHFKSLFIPCVLGSLSLCCYRLGRKPPLMSVTSVHKAPIIAS